MLVARVRRARQAFGSEQRLGGRFSRPVHCLDSPTLALQFFQRKFPASTSAVPPRTRQRFSGTCRRHHLRWSWGLELLTRGARRALLQLFRLLISETRLRDPVQYLPWHLAVAVAHPELVSAPSVTTWPRYPGPQLFRVQERHPNFDALYELSKASLGIRKSCCPG